jgi:hypothetical protein
VSGRLPYRKRCFTESLNVGICSVIVKQEKFWELAHGRSICWSSGCKEIGTYGSVLKVCYWSWSLISAWRREGSLFASLFKSREIETCRVSRLKMFPLRDASNLKSLNKNIVLKYSDEAEDFYKLCGLALVSNDS